MAKVEKTAREKRWDKVWDEYTRTIADPDNEGVTENRAATAVAQKLRLPLTTVRGIIARRKEALYGQAE